MKRTLGFTLIELLVVIAIIMVLAAIILPVYGRTKGAGQKTECLSNIRQIGAATLMYMDEQGGLPIVAGEVPFAGWLTPLGLEDANRVKLRCPSYDPSFGIAGETNAAHDSGYVLNGCLYPGMRPENPLANPAKTVLLTEQTAVLKPKPNPPYWDPVTAEALQGPDCLVYTEKIVSDRKLKLVDTYGCRRHSGGSNYALLDGHSKWIRPEAIRYWSDSMQWPCLMQEPGKWIGPEDGVSFQIFSTNRS